MGRYGLHDAHALYLELVADLVVRESDRAGIRSGRLLDLGCGRGALAGLLAQRPSFSVVGADFVGECLRDAVAARESLPAGGRPQFVRADAYRPPFVDGPFDVVVSTGLGCVGAYLNMESRVERLLRPGGLAFIDFVRLPNLWRPWPSIWRFRQWRREMAAVRAGAHWDGKDLKHYQYERLGIREHFESATSLRLVRCHRLYTWHPLLPGKGAKLLFERTFGRAFSPLLASALLVVLKKETRNGK